MEWSKLQQRFRSLGEKTGISKSSSYQLIVYFEPEGDVIVELGGYDVGSWNRHTYVGTFKTEQEAYAATENKIEEAKKIVAEEN